MTPEPMADPPTPTLRFRA